MSNNLIWLQINRFGDCFSWLKFASIINAFYQVSSILQRSIIFSTHFNVITKSYPIAFIQLHTQEP